MLHMGHTHDLGVCKSRPPKLESVLRLHALPMSKFRVNLAFYTMGSSVSGIVGKLLRTVVAKILEVQKHYLILQAGA